MTEKRGLLLVGVLGILLVGSAQFLMATNWAPHMMGDELMFLLDSRFRTYEEADFPNFVFYAIVRSMGAVGPDMYLAVKLFNSVIWISALLLPLFLLWRTGNLKASSVFAFVALAISPFSLFVQSFTPEALFAFLLTSALLLAFYAANSEKRFYLFLISSGVLFGFASLVKVHALIFATAVVVFVLIGKAMGATPARKFVNSLIFISAVLFSKFAVGYLLAGNAGLTFFGKAYEASLRVFVSNLFSSGFGINAEVQGFPEGQVAQASVFSGLVIPVVLISAGILFAIPAIGLQEKFSSWKLDQQFMAVVIVVGVLAITAFTILVTFLGDDHSERALFRYLEPVLPFAMFLFLRQEQQANSKLWDQVALFAGITLFAWVVSNDFAAPDSSILFTLSLMGPLSAILLGLVIISKTSYFNLNRVTRDYAFATPLLLAGLVGLFAQSSADQAATPYKEAASWVSENISEEEFKSTSVLGASKPLIESTIFMTYKGEADYLIYEQGAIIDAKSIPENIDIVLLLDEIELSDGNFNQFQGEGFRIALRAE